MYIDGERTIETDNTASKSDSDTSAAAADILHSTETIRYLSKVNDADKAQESSSRS